MSNYAKKVVNDVAESMKELPQYFYRNQHIMWTRSEQKFWFSHRPSTNYAGKFVVLWKKKILDLNLYNFSQFLSCRFILLYKNFEKSFFERPSCYHKKKEKSLCFFKLDFEAVMISPANNTFNNWVYPHVIDLEYTVNTPPPR